MHRPNSDFAAAPGQVTPTTSDNAPGSGARVGSDHARDERLGSRAHMRILQDLPSLVIWPPGATLAALILRAGRWIRRGAR